MQNFMMCVNTGLFSPGRSTLAQERGLVYDKNVKIHFLWLWLLKLKESWKEQIAPVSGRVGEWSMATGGFLFENLR